MEALPHHEADTSKEETLLLREALCDAFSILNPRERWLFEAIHYRRLSTRAAGAEIGLSKTVAHRVFQRATQKLQDELADWWSENGR